MPGTIVTIVKGVEFVARVDGPFEYFAEVYPSGGLVTGSSIRSSLTAPGQSAMTILALADDLGDDKRAIDVNVSGDIQTPLVDRTGNVEKSSRTLSASGLYFVGLITEFSRDVDTFDTSVSGLNSDWADEVRRRVTGMLQTPEVKSGDETVDRGAIGQAVKAQLQGRYNTALNTLESAGGSAATRLDQGPTDDNVRALITGGYLPLESATAFPTLTLTAADRAAAVGSSFWTEWLGFKPPVGEGPMDWFGWGFGTLAFGAGAGIDWMSKYRFGGFRPRNARGHFVSPAALGPWGRFRAALGRFPSAAGMSPWQRLRGFDPDGNFGAKGWKGAEFSRWSNAGKLLNRAGGVVTAVTSGWNEWNESAEYPTDERVGRTVTQAAATTGGAVLGAKGGAMLGGAIGTAICPGVGTVVGGVVGGLVGGFVGSQVGEEVGNALKDTGGQIADTVTDVASDVGDAITFWD